MFKELPLEAMLFSVSKSPESKPCADTTNFGEQRFQAHSSKNEKLKDQTTTIPD